LNLTEHLPLSDHQKEISLTKSTCCYCGVGCGVIIETTLYEQGHAIVSGVRGDPDHPANFGRLCTKGSTLHLTADLGLQEQARLHAPAIRASRGSTPVNVGWDEAIQTVASKFADIIHQHGPDSVAIYVSGQILTEDYYIFNKLMKGLIGSNNIDTNSRLCMSSAVAGYKQTLGADAPPCSYEDLDHAQTVFISGSNTAFAHPILYRRLEDARKAHPDMKVIVVDPRKTQTAQEADLFLQIQPGTDIALYHGMLHVMLWEKWIDEGFIARHTKGFDALKDLVRDFTPKAVSSLCGIAEKDLLQAAEWFARSPATLSLYCQGLNQSSSGTSKNAALINLHLACGQIGKPGAGPFSLTGQPNAMGGREVGGLSNLLSAHRDMTNPDHRAEVAALWGVHAVPAQPGYSAVPMFEALRSGKLKAIWIVCTNPAQSMPDLHAVHEGLNHAEFVVVQEAYAHTATTQFADVLLPATTWAEKVGTVTNSERRISKVNPAIPPFQSAKHDWQIALEIGRALERLLPNHKKEGIETLFPYTSVEDIWNEHRASTAGRDLDITGLSYAILETQGPQQWPMPAGHTQGKSRLYEDGIFPTPDTKAQFVAAEYKALAESVNARYPFALNTGRLRDQWHGMSRTGSIGTLFGHEPEPCIEISPIDAGRMHLVNGDLVEVTSRRGSEIFPVKINEGISASQAFIAMHWGSEFISGKGAKTARAGVNSLTCQAIDPYSAQPELKHAAVKIQSVKLPWRAVAFGLFPKSQAFSVQTKLRSLLGSFDSAQCVLFGREQEQTMIGVSFKAAHHEDPYGNVSSEAAVSVKQLMALFELDETSSSVMRYRDVKKGIARYVRAEETVLSAMLTGTEDSLASTAWLRAFLEQGVNAKNLGRSLLLPVSTPPVALKPKSRAICNCFNVSEDTLKSCLSTLSPEITRDAAMALLQKETQCGTNCGSCKPEVKQLIALHLDPSAATVG
jgi:assimilatory nitrate reductase catalytic subunit